MIIACDHCWREIDQDETERELLCDCCYWLCRRCIQLVGGCMFCIPCVQQKYQQQEYSDLIQSFQSMSTNTWMEL